MKSNNQMYITRKEIARKLGISMVTVHNWRNKKLMPEPDFKVENTVRWKTTTIDSWLESRNRNMA